MKFTQMVLILVFSAFTLNVQAASKIDTQDKKYSYTIGFIMANNMKRQNLTPSDMDSFIQALKDVLSGKGSQLTREQMIAAMNEQKKLDAKRKMVAGDTNMKKGIEFQKEYAKRKDVKKLSDGILYRVLKSGKGTSPKATDTVTVNYRGTLINGTEFDSSYKRNKPVSFALNRVIPGWTTTLQHMKPGDKWEVVIPSKMGYGARGAGGRIGPNETLIFEIELLSIKK
jgi:FKBP-type peptidyl-prolyl cis-trans isomerase FklB